VRRASVLAAGLALAGCGRLKPSAAVETRMDASAPEVAGAPFVTTPRRLWRLNNAQVENVTADVLGTNLGVTRGFLPDPRVDGYDDDAVALGISDSHVDELATAAERAAAYVSAPENLMRFAPCADGDLPAACAAAFARGFAGRAWGRALTDDEVARLVEVFRAGSDPEGYAGGIELLTEAALQSPHFVYRLELGAPTDARGVARLTRDETATAMSFLLVGSRPDAELARAAAAGELDDGAGRERQARRLFATPQGRRQLAGFVRAWLGLTAVDYLNKDTGIYPFFMTPVRRALARELGTFLDHVLANGAALDELFTADYTFPSPTLSVLYGDDLLSPPGDFRRVALAPRRRGLLSSPAFLATHALPGQTNPVERGLIVLTRLFCKNLPAPPPGIAGTIPGGPAEQTTRQKYEAHRSQKDCMPCHKLIDPPGFGFEAFDAVGAFRSMEAGQPVDSSGALVGTDIDGPFDGPAQLASMLPRSAQFHRCVSSQLLQFSAGRPPGEGDAVMLDELTGEAVATGFHLDDWLAAFVSRPDFVLRRASEELP
jgi:hypothetical protein